MAKATIRTDKWTLKTNHTERGHLVRTIGMYRALVRALVGVVFVHWPDVARAESPCLAVERLIHATKQNPHPTYSYFDRRFYKFPSYLRRAAIEFALGQVSSFVTRYAEWQSGKRTRPDARPPRLNGDTGVYPTLYVGQCILFHDTQTGASRTETDASLFSPRKPTQRPLLATQVGIKVFDGRDWVWIRLEIAGQRERHRTPTNKRLSPMLVVKGNQASLAVPFQVKVNSRKPTSEQVCAVDLGINTAATVSIVGSDGTVAERKFISAAADMDRRDRRLKQVSRKARQTMGATGKLSQGFCKGQYRKARNINEEMAQRVSTGIIRFALAFGVTVIVFEYLKGWRPTGGKQGSTLRQRFHGWLHRRIVQLVTEKWVECGGQVAFVPARGTSSQAFDGSGPVLRDSDNYSLARFPNDKRYHADLSASYNIGARYWAHQLKPRRGNDPRTGSGKSSRPVPRMPVTLSTLWAQHPCTDAEREALVTPVQAG